MQSQGSKIIRAYSAPLDEISKEETRIGLKNESVRIAVCTEALGMGVDIRTITRVVQYGLDSTVDIRNLYQRFGRVGRDPSTIGLALVFVTTTNLRTKETLPITEKGQDGMSMREDEEYPIIDDNDGYTIAMTEENWPVIQSFLHTMHEGPKTDKKGRQAKATEGNLAHGVSG